MWAHTYTYSHNSLKKTTYTGPIIAHGTVTQAVNQTPVLIVLDGFEPPALIQTRPLFKVRPLFGHIRYVVTENSMVSGGKTSEVGKLDSFFRMD